MLQDVSLKTHPSMNSSLQTDNGTFCFLYVRVLFAPPLSNIATSHVHVPQVSPPGDSIVLNLFPIFPILRKAECVCMFASTTARGLPTLHYWPLRSLKWDRGLSVSPTLHHRVLFVRYMLTLPHSSSARSASPCEEAATTDPTAVRANTNSLLSLDQVHQDALHAFQEATSAYVRMSMRCAHTKVTHKRLRTHHRLSGAHLAIGMQTDASRRPLPCPSTYVRLERTVMVWLRPPRRVFPCSASVSAAASFSSSDPSAAAACRTRSFCAL